MSEIVWYILPGLDGLLRFLRQELPRTALINLLTVYPSGQQRYGTEWFTDFRGLMDYFQSRGLVMDEWSQVHSLHHDGTMKTYFCGHWA